LGLNYESLDATVQLYPNPTKGIFSLELPAFVAFEKMEIYNALGQQVGSSTVPTFSLAALSSGIYQVSITTSAGIIHKKVIKK